MGRDFPPPELAESWGEYLARLDREQATQQNRWIPLWWAIGTMLFVTGLIFCAYATQSKNWLLWVGMLAPLTAAGVLAVRALDRAERIATKRTQLTEADYTSQIRGGAIW